MGVPPPGGAAATDARYLTDDPAGAGFALDASVVVVAAFDTASVTTPDVLAPTEALPRYCAVSMWTPTAKFDFDRVATPLGESTPDPIRDALS